MGFLLKLDQSPRRTSKMNGYDRIFLGNLDIMVEPAWAIEVGNLAKPCKLCAVLTNFPTFKYNDSYLWWIALEKVQRFNVTFQNELGFRISEKEGPRIWDTEGVYEVKWYTVSHYVGFWESCGFRNLAIGFLSWDYFWMRIWTVLGTRSTLRILLPHWKYQSANFWTFLSIGMWNLSEILKQWVA